MLQNTRTGPAVIPSPSTAPALGSESLRDRTFPKGSSDQHAEHRNPGSSNRCCYPVFPPVSYCFSCQEVTYLKAKSVAWLHSHVTLWPYKACFTSHTRVNQERKGWCHPLLLCRASIETAISGMS